MITKTASCFEAAGTPFMVAFEKTLLVVHWRNCWCHNYNAGRRWSFSFDFYRSDFYGRDWFRRGQALFNFHNRFFDLLLQIVLHSHRVALLAVNSPLVFRSVGAWFEGLFAKVLGKENENKLQKGSEAPLFLLTQGNGRSVECTGKLKIWSLVQQRSGLSCATSYLGSGL